MQRLLEVCKHSKVADIMRAAIFLERALEVRGGKPSKQNSVAPAASHGFEAEGCEGRQSLDMVSPVVLKKL